MQDLTRPFLSLQSGLATLRPDAWIRAPCFVGWVDLLRNPKHGAAATERVTVAGRGQS